MESVLGLDSGGTKTVAAVVGRSGEVLSIIWGAGLDPTAGPEWEAELIRMIGLIGPVGIATLGLPFHGEMPEVSATQTAIAKAVVGEDARVMNDVAVAFEGALAGAEGVLILAGTGSMGWARGPLGEVRTGGWGDAFGDEGSAFWIGREALGLVSRHLDGRRPAPEFAHGLLHHIGISGDQLIGWTYRHAQPRAEMAALARLVSELANEGCDDARQVLAGAAVHLAEIGSAAARAAGLAEPVCWSHAGGVFSDATVLREVTRLMGNRAVPPRLPPVGGAVLHSARRAGWTVDDTFIGRLNQSLGDRLPE
jgi:glucosamine kinase